MSTDKNQHHINLNYPTSIPLRIFANPNLSKNEIFLYGLIEQMEYGTGIVFFTNSKLGKIIGVHPRSVSRMASNLEKEGFLERYGKNNKYWRITRRKLANADKEPESNGLTPSVNPGCTSSVNPGCTSSVNPGCTSSVNQNNVNSNNDNNKHTQSESASLFELGEGKISKDVIRLALTKYSYSYVEEKIKLVISKKPDSYDAYFKAALKGNYKNDVKAQNGTVRGDIIQNQGEEMPTHHNEPEIRLNEAGYNYPIFAPEMSTDEFLKKRKEYAEVIQDVAMMLKNKVTDKEIHEHLNQLKVKQC